MVLMPAVTPHHLTDAHDATGRTRVQRSISAVKVRALSFLSFGVFLFLLLWHVLTYGWNVSGDALFAALTTLSGLTYLRPMWFVSLLQRWGG